MPRPTLPLVLLLLAAAAACDAPERTTQAQLEARRDACVAEELLISARGRLASLDTVLAGATPGTPTAVLMRPAHAFAAAYLAYAERRHRQTAYEDSAAFAASTEDSSRLASQAAGFASARPTQGTVDGNAGARYEQDFTRARGNPDHPCNQELEAAAGES